MTNLVRSEFAVKEKPTQLSFNQHCL